MSCLLYFTIAPMTFFQVEFYPPKGENHSPFDILTALDESRRTSIRKHLEKFEKIEYHHWSRSWSKQHTGDILQFDSGDYRIMFVLDRPYLIVLHIFRKQGQKTHPRALRRAISNYEAYQEDPRRR